MNKRSTIAYREQRELQSSGWDVDAKRAVRLHTNPQDETRFHAHAKMAVGKVLAEAGYRIDSEVLHEPSGNIADILAYGRDGRLPCVVELETECSEGLKKDNLQKYAHGPVEEVYTIPLDELPRDIDGLHDRVKLVLGL